MPASRARDDAHAALSDRLEFSGSNGAPRDIVRGEGGGRQGRGRGWYSQSVAMEAELLAPVTPKSSCRRRFAPSLQ